MYHCCSLPVYYYYFVVRSAVFLSFLSFFLFFGSLSCSHFTWYNAAIKRAIYFHFTFGYPRQSTSFNEFNTLFILLNCWNSRTVEAASLIPCHFYYFSCWGWGCCCCCEVINKLLAKSGKSINANSNEMPKAPSNQNTAGEFSFFRLNYLVFHFNQSVNGEQIVKLNNSVELICHSVVSTENSNSNAIYLISNHCHFSCQFSGTPISNNWISRWKVLTAEAHIWNFAWCCKLFDYNNRRATMNNACKAAKTYQN